MSLLERRWPCQRCHAMEPCHVCVTREIRALRAENERLGGAQARAPWLVKNGEVLTVSEPLAAGTRAYRQGEGGLGSLPGSPWARPLWVLCPLSAGERVYVLHSRDEGTDYWAVTP